jgi:hydroxymethylbilane synthase
MGLRGNLDTRLRKVARGDYDAIIVAACGLLRMGWEDRITEYLPLEVSLPAVGQGALAVEVRQDDEEALALVSAIDHEPTRQAITAERAFLEGLGGGCQIPIAALGEVKDGTLELEGMVASLGGPGFLRAKVLGETDNPEAVGRLLADKLLSLGAGQFLEEKG